MNSNRKNPEHPVFEMLRLAALESYGILDTPPEIDFDHFVRVASKHFKAPISTISLIDEQRQWFKARIGISLAETDREEAFCTHVVASGKTLIVHDAAVDGRFAFNPLVTAGPRIRFYAGAPLITPLKRCLGTLNVIDTVARPQWSGDDTSALETMAAQVMVLLEKRRANLVIQRALDDRPNEASAAVARR